MEQVNVLTTEELNDLLTIAKNDKIREWRRHGYRIVFARSDGYWWDNSSTRDETILAQKPSRKRVLDIIKNNPNVTEIGFNGTIKVGNRVGEELEIADDFDIILWTKK
jgi:hypothetical protein